LALAAVAALVGTGRVASANQRQRNGFGGTVRLRNIFRLHRRESNLVKHARRELALLGDQDDPMNAHMNRNLLSIVQAFADQGHSGFSAAYAIGALTKLLDFQPLTALTGEPGEWNEVGEDMWQNRRCSRVFSRTGTPDGYAYDIEGRVFVDPDGDAYTNRNSHVRVWFPYVPKTERVMRDSDA
jgi:hypothetical protein